MPCTFYKFKSRSVWLLVLFSSIICFCSQMLKLSVFFSCYFSVYQCFLQPCVFVFLSKYSIMENRVMFNKSPVPTYALNSHIVSLTASLTFPLRYPICKHLKFNTAKLECLISSISSVFPTWRNGTTIDPMPNWVCSSISSPYANNQSASPTGHLLNISYTLYLSLTGNALSP